MTGLYKDAVLDDLANRANIAQFVSFAPDGSQRFARIIGEEPNTKAYSLDAVVEVLLSRSPERSVNVRSFTPETPEGNEFLYGLESVDRVREEVRRLGSQGLYTIVNETVDVNDGGVSGVALGGALEFAPKATPRVVEKGDVASTPQRLGVRLLEAVYGFRPALPFSTSHRVEWSLHPVRRGVRREHTIIWQLERVKRAKVHVSPRWPNLFSRFIGDKAYGLLYGHALGLSVPRTTVVPRWLPPFSFGRSTGTGETWLRTCPTEQQPGLFTTEPRWVDPYRLLKDEDPSDSAIASVLAQEGVNAQFSGAVLTSPDGEIVVEGVHGRGDEFMLGRHAPETLPSDVRQAVRLQYDCAAEALGPVRMEWVFDGQTAWIVQLHVGASVSSSRVIVPGSPSEYVRFVVKQGIDDLRRMIPRVKQEGKGIILVGRVGVTSHFGDLLRRAAIPSSIEPEDGSTS